MPKSVDRSVREMILKIRAFCEKEKKKNCPIIPLHHVRARVAAMTGISQKTVSRISKEALAGKIGVDSKADQVEATEEGKEEIGPDGKIIKRKKVSKKVAAQKLPPVKRHRNKKVQLDDGFMTCTIRNKIHEYYTIRNEVPTLSKLLTELKNEINFNGGRTTLWKIIIKLGFKFKKCGRKHFLMMGDDDEAAMSNVKREEKKKKEAAAWVQPVMAPNPQFPFQNCGPPVPFVTNVSHSMVRDPTHQVKQNMNFV